MKHNTFGKTLAEIIITFPLCIPYQVFRSTDPGIMHVYHGKDCDPKLSEEQFSDCMGSKADWEGTKKVIGVFGENKYRHFKRFVF